jgi:nitrogenase-stabilizing/protective protein
MSCSLDDKPIDPTDIAKRLKRLSSAEDFFMALGVTHDEAVLRVARLHILKRMGEYLAGDDLGGVPDVIAAARAKAVLQRAYSDFESSSPLVQRVFKVLKEHDPDRPVPAKSAFVSLDAIAPLPPR